MDKLIVKGLKSLDGEYDFDIVSLIAEESSPDYLTYRELHRIKTMTGIRGGEISDAFLAGDTDVMLAIAAILLARSGKTFDEGLLWDARGPELMFTIADRKTVDGGDEEIPPDSESPQNEPTEQRGSSGDASSKQTSASPENGQSPTGLLASATPATFGHVTSAK